MGKVLLSQWFVITVAVGLFAALASTQDQGREAPAQLVATQPPPVERDRTDRGDDRNDAAQPREGGIPREQVVTPDGEAEEGTEEGLPQLRSTPGDRRVAPLLVPPDRRRWRLGVFAYNTDTGIVVTRVVFDSAAQRAGLERGDRIVTIDGYQVGWVNDRLYPLGEELQRRAGRRGYVKLLVQNVRNDRLVNVGVELDRYDRFQRDRFDADRDRLERNRNRDRDRFPLFER